MKYHIQTFGCQMNNSDTERVATILEQSGYIKADTLEDVDLYIFNTCSIKQKGEDKVYGLIKNVASYKKANPRLLIGITGCMVHKSSTRNSEKKDPLLLKRSKVDFVFRITDTHKLPEILAEAEPNLEIEYGSMLDYLKITPTYTSKFQAFVPIQIGCDKYCTYCIVPYSRGREQSRSMNDIINECTKLVENGCKEITLVGQTVNSYGLSALDKLNFHLEHNSKSSVHPFSQLLTELDKLHSKGLSRLRYTSPHPKDLNTDLINAHATLKTLCNYIHLPIQSGDNRILTSMNRKYSIEEYCDRFQKLRTAVPNMVISSDIIVGFCGESEEQFENTVRLFEKMRWDQVYISRYSERKGTMAAKGFKDDISAELKAKRWHRLNNLLKIISKEKNKLYEGKTLEILVERFNPLTKECEGRSREYKLVQFPGQPNQVGKIFNLKIIKGLDWVLKAKAP